MLVIKANKLEEFLKELKSRFDFFDCRESTMSPKQYFFPSNEVTFKLKIGNKKTRGKAVIPGITAKKFILYGLSLRDLEAITYLDEVMKKPKEDFFYFRKRRKSLLIGLTDERFDIPPGGDIILRSLIMGDCEVLIITNMGKKLLSDLKFNFSESEKPDFKSFPNQTMPELKKLLLDPELLKDAVEWSWKGSPKIWDDLKEQCLGCGICTYVCPLCYCFSVEDSVELSGEYCRRCRKWTACTLPEFAKIAGGHNFHKTVKERYYNWFYHKFARGYLEFGKPQCVACGRCQQHCPAKIDIEKVLLDIVKRYKETTL